MGMVKGIVNLNDSAEMLQIFRSFSVFSILIAAINFFGLFLRVYFFAATDHLHNRYRLPMRRILIVPMLV